MLGCGLGKALTPLGDKRWVIEEVEENGAESGENPLVSSSFGGPGEGRVSRGEGVDNKLDVAVGTGLTFADTEFGECLSPAAISPAGDRAEMGVFLPDRVFGLMELLKPSKAVALGRAEKIASDHATDSRFPASVPTSSPLLKSPRPSERDMRGTVLSDIRGALSSDSGVAVFGEGTESDAEGVRFTVSAAVALVGVTLFSPLIGRGASRGATEMFCSDGTLLGAGGSGILAICCCRGVSSSSSSSPWIAIALGGLYVFARSENNGGGGAGRVGACLMGGVTTGDSVTLGDEEVEIGISFDRFEGGKYWSRSRLNEGTGEERGSLPAGDW